MPWKRAFRYSVKVLLFSAIWLVVGVALLFVGIGLLSATPRIGLVGAIGGMLVVGVGYVLLYLGFLTALFKYLPQAITEEIKRTA